MQCKRFFWQHSETCIAVLREYNYMLSYILSYILNYILSKYMYILNCCNFEWVEVRKISEIFGRNCIEQNFLPEVLKLVDTLQIWGFYSFIFWFKFLFFGTVLGHFNRSNFKNFPPWPTGGPHFYWALPFHKKGSYHHVHETWCKNVYFTNSSFNSFIFVTQIVLL